MKSTAIYENRVQDKKEVERIQKLPEISNGKFSFMTSMGTLFATDYTRIVYGDHGPYIEFEPEHIACELKSKFGGELPKKSFYEWMVVSDGSQTKVYDQKKDVKALKNPPKGGFAGEREEGYADYKVGKIYVSPWELLPVPTGEKTVNFMVTGHRPQKLGGYDPNNPITSAVRKQMRSILIKAKDKHGDKLRCITGMALGVDRIFAELAIELGVKFYAFVPMLDAAGNQPEESREHFQSLLNQAEACVYVVHDRPKSFGWALNLRNVAMVKNSQGAMAVWDGSKGGTANCVADLQKMGIPTLFVNPKKLKTN